MTIGMAVVGAGYWGPNLIRNFSNLPGCNLVGACDLDPARLKIIADKYPGIRTTTRLADFLSDPSIQAIAVATPAESHRSVIESALRAGKHVYVEKPLTANSGDAEFVVHLAQQLGLVLMTGHIFLYDSAVNGLIEMVQRGAIGQMRYAHVTRTSMAGTARLDTNIIWDALIHDAYILPALFGRLPKRVLAVGAGYLSPGLEDVSFVTFDFGGERLAQIYVSWYALDKVRRITAIGSTHVLVYDDLAESKLNLFARRYEQSEELDPRGRRRWHWHDDGVQSIAVPPAESLRVECEHFIDCIAQGKTPRTDGLAGWEAVRVLEACQRSLESNNAWVEVL